MRVTTATIAMCFTVSCLAHQDRILTVDDDGTLVGLPTEYSPASLRVSFSDAVPGIPPIGGVSLTIGGRSLSLPLCATSLLTTSSIKDVFVSASWYHDEELLPYYLNVLFFDPGTEGAELRPGYSMLFNLRTAKLMRMEVDISRDNGRSLQRLPIDLAERCSPSEMKEFSDGIAPAA